MGVKRPLDEDTIQELSFKQAKQLDGNNEPTEISEDISPHEVSHKGDFEGKVGESEGGGELENDKAHKEPETSATLSWVTSSSSEEEAGNGRAFFLPLYPDFFEFNIPRRPPVQFEDAYSYLLNGSPRKEIPVGSDYQAVVPEWDPDAIRKNSLGSNYTTDDGNEQKLVGTSIILMPDAIVLSCDMKIGHGRMDCYCSDKVSIRCVRQHVEEARERLRESLGEEKFADLGFLCMGEEVAHKWTEEEERVFHEVVYSNPVSLGKKFWQHLSVVFPSRTKMEIVGYYFNVFILRRRAVQNRCSFLDIDSDDDEWQDGRFPRVEGDDDGAVIESFNDEHLQPDHEISDDNEEINQNEGDDFDDSDDDGDGDVRAKWGDAIERGNQEKQMSQEPEKSKEDPGLESNAYNMDKDVCGNIENHDTQEGTYSEGHPFLMTSSASVGEDNTIRENVQKSENMRCSEGLSNGNEALGAGYVVEHCDAKAWDDTFSMNSIRNIDLLPTRSMIEEIFGPCSWKKN